MIRVQGDIGTLIRSLDHLLTTDRDLTDQRAFPTGESGSYQRLLPRRSPPGCDR